MGGDFRASKDRQKKDHYPTYFSLTEQLLEVEDFPKNLVEPCCGEHDAVGQVLRRHGYSVESSDLWYGPKENRRDFLIRTEPCKGIVTNPPFKLGNSFLEVALNVVEQKFAFLLPIDFLHGNDRYNTFYKNGIPLSKVYVLTQRPLFGKELRADGKYPTGATTFAWFIFEQGFKGEHVFGWIDNYPYILRAKDKTPQKEELFRRNNCYA